MKIAVSSHGFAGTSLLIFGLNDSSLHAHAADSR